MYVKCLKYKILIAYDVFAFKICCYIYCVIKKMFTHRFNCIKFKQYITSNDIK